MCFLLSNHMYALFLESGVLLKVHRACASCTWFFLYVLCMRCVPLVQSHARFTYLICVHHFPDIIIQVFYILDMRSVHSLSTPRTSYQACLMHALCLLYAPCTLFAFPLRTLCMLYTCYKHARWLLHDTSRHYFEAWQIESVYNWHNWSFKFDFKILYAGFETLTSSNYLRIMYLLKYLQLEEISLPFSMQVF